MHAFDGIFRRNRMANPPGQPLTPVVTSMVVAIAFGLGAIFLLSSPTNAFPKIDAARPTGSMIHQVAVFGVDDRRIMPKGRHRLRDRIGVLSHRGTGQYCTAFCVGRNVIATAGHCILGTASGRAAGFAKFEFHRDSGRGQSPARIAGWRNGTTALNIVTGADRLNTRPPINASADWALIRLDRDACPAGGLAISNFTRSAIEERASNGRVYHVSYHRDIRNWRLAESRRCGVMAETPRSPRPQIEADFTGAENLLLHTCDTEAASSGSPLLVEGPSGPEVIGINVGTYVRSRIVTHDGEVIERLSSETVANTALVASQLIANLNVLERTTPVAHRYEIERIQAALAARGHFAGALDGRYGPLTRAAIRAFESKSGMFVTGLATRELLAKLMNDNRTAPATTSSLSR